MERVEPVPIERHAAEQLRFIRDTMERAAVFTAVPGWAGVAIGCSALAAGFLVRGRLPGDQFAAWIAEACVASCIGAGGVWWKARRAHVPLASRPGKRALAGFAAPLIAGGVLTTRLYGLQQFDVMPGMWLLLYGTAVMSAGAHSVRIVPLMGVCFAIFGAFTLLTNVVSGNAAMMLGFGILHLIFGILIASEYGG